MKFYLVVILNPDDWADVDFRVTRSKQAAIDSAAKADDWEIREFNINEVWSDPLTLKLVAWTDPDGQECLGDPSFWPNQGEGSITPP